MSLTTIQAFNKIAMKLRNIKTDLTVLTSLTVEQNLILEEMKTVYQEISTYTFWSPLKKRNSPVITLSTGVNAYALPTDFYQMDTESMKYDNDDAIPLGSQQLIDRVENDRTKTGEPNFYYIKGGNFVFDQIPDAKANGKTITYDYFYIPTALSTTSAALWIPTPFDDTVFCNWVLRNMFENREANQAQFYNSRLHGGRKEVGSLEKMLAAYEDQIVNEQISHADSQIVPENSTRDYGWRAN